MHWVWATTLYRNKDGSAIKTLVNLDKIFQMRREDSDAGPVTILYFGAVTATIQGQCFYGNEKVIETPEQLLAQAPVQVGPVPPEETAAQLSATLGRKKSRTSAEIREQGGLPTPARKG